MTRPCLMLVPSLGHHESSGDDVTMSTRRCLAIARVLPLPLDDGMHSAWKSDGSTQATMTKQEE